MRFFLQLNHGNDRNLNDMGIELTDRLSAAPGDELRPSDGFDPVVVITDADGRRMLHAVPLLSLVESRELFLEKWAREASVPERVRQWRSWFGAIEEVVAAGYFEIEVASGALHHSDGFLRVTGWPEGSRPSLKRVLARLTRSARGALLDGARTLLATGGRLDQELELGDGETKDRMLRIFGVRQRTEDGGVWFRGVCVDVSRLRGLERRIWHASHHDSLTGLANRGLFQERLEARIAEAAMTGHKIGLMLLDIDHLRDINARLGMAAGDEVLQRTGYRLSALTAPDRVGRVGDDQFGVILAGLRSVSQAVTVATELRRKISWEEEAPLVSVTAGVAASPDHGSTAADLIAGAEIALGIAKSSHNRRVQPLKSERDKDRFRHETFEFIAKFFENSLSELEARNDGIETDFRRVDANRFTASVYKGGKAQARCTIFIGGAFDGGIAFRHGESSDTNTINESMNVHADDQAMYLRTFGMANLGGERDAKLSQEGAAEYYWSLLINALQ